MNDSAEAEVQPGIECPSCGCRHHRTIRTRKTWGGKVARRRECRNCKRRFTTYEKVESDPES